MKLDVRSRHLTLSRRDLALVARRLHFALGRLLGPRAVVRVRFEDLNGPRGGVDCRCRIRIVDPRAGRVDVEATGATLPSATAWAAARAARVVARRKELAA